MNFDELCVFLIDIQSFSSMGMEVAVPSLAKNSIITHILRKSDHVEKITSSKSDLDIHAVPTDPSRSEISEFVERTISSKARSASAELRLQDALSSFNYLLLEEAYLDINTVSAIYALKINLDRIRVIEVTKIKYSCVYIFFMSRKRLIRQ